MKSLNNRYLASVASHCRTGNPTLPSTHASVLSSSQHQESNGFNTHQHQPQQHQRRAIHDCRGSNTTTRYRSSSVWDTIQRYLQHNPSSSLSLSQPNHRQQALHNSLLQLSILPDPITSKCLRHQYHTRSSLSQQATYQHARRSDLVLDSPFNTIQPFDESDHTDYFPHEDAYDELSDNIDDVSISSEKPGKISPQRKGKAGTDLVKADISDVTIVNNAVDAKRVLSILTSFGVRSRYHAIDTEVKEIDVKEQSPVGNGRITCFSVYVGHDISFAASDSVHQPRLYVNCLDTTDGSSMFDIFKSYLEDARIKKVWHNYGFDRHVFYNHGIDVKGFGADTMHMARLWNASRKQQGGYALSELSHELLGADYAKRSMKERFSRAKLKKDGTVGLTYVLPPVDEIQRATDFYENWIDYATFDSKATFMVREQLELKLRQMPWSNNNNSNGSGNGGSKDSSMYDFYQRYYVPFGELLTDMERAGFYIREEYLPDVQKQAEAEREEYIKKFREWASTQIGDVAYQMNVQSAAQKQQLFYGAKGSVREFKCDNEENIVPEGKSKPPKYLKFHLPGLGLPSVNKTKKGQPQVDYATLVKLAGTKLQTQNPKYGAAYAAFGGGEAGAAACHAINALCSMSQVEIMINTFIISLQASVDAIHRVHCSLNLNTETGRLSSRRPNLQNQPALEKDRYKIRDAFAASPSNKLIVADYGQLELRVLAHMTACESMIRAFQLGGDFHSRTAYGMYPHIKEAVAAGKCILEWDGDGKAPLPLVKDLFGSERRKAKILNFSIAYGKTVHGLASDFGVSKQDAMDTVQRWYSDRPEVKEWQEHQIQQAKVHGWTRTLMGRYRPLPDILHTNKAIRSHNERAAINTPIQGGAADIVMMAMLKLHGNQRFRDLGWKIILQVHDEIICEGPEESTEEAMTIVRNSMQHPFKNPLLVDLTVDASADYTWYKAK